MAYVEKYERTCVYTRKSLGIIVYGILDTVFYEVCSNLGGKGAQGQRDNHYSHEGEK